MAWYKRRVFTCGWGVHTPICLLFGVIHWSRRPRGISAFNVALVFCALKEIYNNRLVKCFRYFSYSLFKACILTASLSVPCYDVSRILCNCIWILHIYMCVILARPCKNNVHTTHRYKCSHGWLLEMVASNSKCSSRGNRYDSRIKADWELITVPNGNAEHENYIWLKKKVLDKTQEFIRLISITFITATYIKYENGVLYWYISLIHFGLDYRLSITDTIPAKMVTSLVTGSLVDRLLGDLRFPINWLDLGPARMWWHHSMALFLHYFFWGRKSTGWFPSQRASHFFMFPFLLAWTSCWTNNQVTGDSRCHNTHMISLLWFTAVGCKVPFTLVHTKMLYSYTLSREYQVVRNWYL